MKLTNPYAYLLSPANFTQVGRRRRITVCILRGAAPLGGVTRLCEIR